MPTVGFSIWRLHPSSLLFIFLITSIHVTTMSAMQGSYEDVVTKQFITRIPRSGSRVLVEKGTQCNSGNAKECASPNGGTEQMNCCTKMCTDVLSDTNNCGSCGKQCSFGQLCCLGTCTTVAVVGLFVKMSLSALMAFAVMPLEAVYGAVSWFIRFYSSWMIPGPIGVSLSVVGQKLSVQLG